MGQQVGTQFTFKTLHVTRITRISENVPSTSENCRRCSVSCIASQLTLTTSPYTRITRISENVPSTSENCRRCPVSCVALQLTLTTSPYYPDYPVSENVPTTFENCRKCSDDFLRLLKRSNSLNCANCERNRFESLLGSLCCACRQDTTPPVSLFILIHQYK